MLSKLGKNFLGDSVLTGVGRDRREILLMEKKEEEARFAKERKAKVAKTDKKTTALLSSDLRPRDN